MATLYLAEALHPDAFQPGRQLVIDGAEARHAAQVARVRLGERIAIGDGRGRIAWGPVVRIAQGAVAIEADEVVVATASRPRLRLVQALAKGDRDELAVQAATELGVDEIVPWQAARSVSVWKGDKVAKGVERWRSIVREAAKQSIRPAVPPVAAPVDTAGLVRALPEWGRVLVLDPSGATGLTAEFPTASTGDLADAEVTLVVGPEGGIAREELLELDAAGARVVRLGREVLRTSTAGPAAIAAILAVLGRWS